MLIYDKTGNIILDVQVDDTSYRYRAIRQGDKVYLYFSLTEHIEIPTYSYIEFQGQRYTLWKPENLTKHGERNIEYTVEFWGWWEVLSRTKYKLLSSKPHKLKFPLTATPRMFMQLLIDNLNLHDSGWKLGTCIEASEKVMAFSHETCLEVINRFADEYNTEFEFVNKTVNFGKVERFKDDPLPLSYGKGNGFKTGVTRQNQGDKAPVTILYVQGGERNIDVSKYKSSTLLLPKKQELEYQKRRYKTDEDGMFITRADRDLTNYNEDGYDASNIYPSRVGTVSEVIVVDAEQHFYDIKDDTIPVALDYSKCRIDGQKATIIFQSGILTGKEFDLEQTEKDLTGYIHAERRFKIVPQEINGTIMPDETFKPSVGDKYAIFNISLPDAYVCDDATKTGASWDMFREAVQYMYENEEENFTFKGELDGIWAKKRWLEIGGKLQPGSYILFSDKQFQPDGLPIRITGIKDYINKPHSPEIELSNTPVAGFISSELGKIDGNEVKDEERHKDALSFTTRRWRDAVEMQGMLEDAFKEYGKGQSAAWLRTMSVLVGHESLQFQFVDRIPTSDSSIVTELEHAFHYDNSTKIFSTPAGIIQHMTMGIDTLSSSHKITEYKFWNIGSYVSPSLDDPAPLFLYLKCSKSNQTGSFLFSKEPKDMDGADGYYYFLTGALSSDVDNKRSFATLYGFSELGPGWMRIRLIISPDGNTYFNVGMGEIGGKIVLKAGSSGLSQLAEWAGVSKTIANTVDAANKAKDAADNAQSSANSAVSRLNNWASDSYISPTEKIALKQQQMAVEAEYAEISDQAVRYKLTETNSWENFNTAYGYAIDAFNKYTASTPENIYVSSDYAMIAQYYTYRNYMLRDIANAAKKAVDDLASQFGDLDYLKEAISNETAVIGGLLLTSMLKLGVRSGSTWIEKAGINGTAKIDTDVIAWFGGTLTQAINDQASIVFRQGGAGQLGAGAIKWYKENGAWTAAFDGIVKMKALQMTMVDLGNSDAVSSGSWSGYTMYKLKTNMNIIAASHNGVILPTSLSYEGAIAVVHNNEYPPYTKSFYGVVIRTENGHGIGGINRDHTDWSTANDPTEVYIGGQVVQFMAVKVSSYIKWIALNYK